jgi:glycyl-tRNA synthetase (class II)
MRELNPQIEFVRVETPCIIPSTLAQTHMDANFPLWHVSGGSVTDINDYDDEHFWLRPESTAGTYVMFKELFPQESKLRKRLPLCLWQVGLSFRREQDKTFRNLRFKQFYQMEFQLAYAESTMADYHLHAVRSIQRILDKLFPQWTPDEIGSVDLDEIPFYSERTTDLYVKNHEVVAISSRTDFTYPILEVSCGLDRLTALYQDLA